MVTFIFKFLDVCLSHVASANVLMLLSDDLLFVSSPVTPVMQTSIKPHDVLLFRQINANKGQITANKVQN